jgi:RNA polymerase sigma factor (sigma-70 family)
MTAGTHFTLQLEDERRIAEEILQLESELRELLSRMPSLERPRRRNGRGRTRAGDVDRIEEAVNAIKDAEADPELVQLAAAKWEEAERLRWQLALSAVAVARREARRLRRGAGSLTETDLVQEATLGLLAAAKRFEPSRGIRFATYARWWARAAITRAIDRARVVRMSGAACEQLRNLRLYVRDAESRGEEWSVAQAAEVVGVDPEYASRLLNRTAAASLDAPAEGDESNRPVTLMDEDSPSPEESACRREEVKMVLSAVERVLDDRERKVVLGRFGIGVQAGTLNEVAAGLSISRERVRQIEKRSLRLLRKACAPLQTAS